MNGFEVAEPYAQALFRLPSSLEEKEVRKKLLTFLSELWKTQPFFARFFYNPEISKEEKSSFLKKGIADLDLINFLLLVFDKGKIRFLPEIATKYEQLVSAVSGRLIVTVVTAIPLDAALKNRIQTQFAKRYARNVALIEKTDRQLIGGALFLFENKLIDFSMKRRLEALKYSLLKDSHAQT